MKLWGGRFRKKTAPELEALGRSLDFDRRFAEQEIRVNAAYVRALERAGLLTRAESARLVEGLERVRERIASDPAALAGDDEDIHTAVERLLGEAIGELAGKLATGRSRNDLSATEFRLFVAEAAEGLAERVLELERALLARAEQTRDVVLPGYTHLRRGQPVVFAQYLLADLWALDRDRERLLRAAERARELPLGAGAIAGNPFGVDRSWLAGELGFGRIFENSIDAVSARDFALEFLAAGAILGVQLSRMAEDLVLWSMDELGFVEIDDAYATGSSLMPQKKNPDGLELVRGKAGRLVGNLAGLLTTVKGLPTGYQRDLQEDKEAVLDTVDTLGLCLPVMEGTIRTLVVRPERMAAALSPELLATDLADYLVSKGVPFREAHGIVGRVLLAAAEEGVEPSALPLERLRALSAAFDEDVAAVWDYRAAVERKTSRGGVARRAMDEQIRRARRAVGGKAGPGGITPATRERPPKARPNR